MSTTAVDTNAAFKKVLFERLNYFFEKNQLSKKGNWEVLLYRLSSWQGMQVDRGTWLLTLLPLAIAQGRWTALAAVVGVVIVAVSNDRLFSAGEKHEIAETFRRAARRLKVWLHPRTRQMSEPA